MAESITGNVTGKVGFKIDKKSWDTLEKFKSQLTNIKRQMSTLHKTVKVQAVVKQVADVNKKIVKAQEQTSKAIVDTKVKMARKLAKVDNDGRLAHLFPTESSAKASNTILAKQMVEQQKILDKANKAQFAADLKAEKEYNKRRDMLLQERAKRNLARTNRRDFFNQRADMYQSIKLQQAKHAGVDETGLNQISSRVAYARKQYQNTGDIAAFRNEVQLTTRALIHQTRQMNANAVSLRTLRTDLVQATAAYTAFSGLVNVASTGMTMEGLTAGAKVFAGDEAGVADHMKFIADEADRLGVNMLTATKEFTKFSIATKNKISKDAGRNIFSGISEYAAVLQVDDQQFERAFRSINQMLSKGQLMKEEISGSNWPPYIEICM